MRVIVLFECPKCTERQTEAEEREEVHSPDRISLGLFFPLLSITCAAFGAALLLLQPLQAHTHPE